jgi:hypothetical protein
MERYKMTLSKWHKKIYNAETGEETFIEYTEDEIAIAEAQELALKNDLAKRIAKEQKEADAKAKARQVILDRLGLTADEAAILLG